MGRYKQLLLCPPVCSPHVCIHMWLFYCVHLKVSTFMAVEQRGVSLGAEAAACSRGPAPGSPYPIQLGFVIGSPGLKDTVHPLTRLNACKMSNQRSVWSLRPPRQAVFLQAVAAGPGRPLSDDLGSRSLFPPHVKSPSRGSYGLGGKHAGTCVPTIHQTR